MIKYSLLLCLVFCTLCYGKSVKNRAKTGRKVQTNDDALKFFDQFGYNKCENPQTRGNTTGLLCQASFKSMIEHFQIVHRLPVTRKLDQKTIDLMNRPRCSLGDYPMGFSAFQPWPNKTLKWRLVGDIPKFGRAKTRAIIQEAFNDWAHYAPLKFRESPDDDSAEFVIDFLSGDHRDGYPFDGPAGTLAHAFFPKDGRIHFDASEDWSEKYTNDGGFNFRLVASHEIGHALGLAHSLDSKALMYPFYQLFQPKKLLPKDDRDGIRALYGTSATNKPTTFAPTTTSPAVTTTKKNKKTKATTYRPPTTTSSVLSHDRCARYLDVVFGGGPDKWLYTLDYEHVWRYHPDFGQWDTQGIPITNVFPGAEPHMMAGILSPRTQKIYLFKGARVWRFSLPNVLDDGFPKRLIGTGSPYNPIAALYDDGHIWLLKGDLLFRFHESTLRYESEKPPERINERYAGVPGRVRTAFTHNGKHYFFTEPDRNVYVYNTKTRRLDPGYPRPMTTGWFACKNPN